MHSCDAIEGPRVRGEAPTGAEGAVTDHGEQEKARVTLTIARTR
jgi:hypothetical protein